MSIKRWQEVSYVRLYWSSVRPSFSWLAHGQENPPLALVIYSAWTFIFLSPRPKQTNKTSKILSLQSGPWYSIAPDDPKKWKKKKCFHGTHILGTRVFFSQEKLLVQHKTGCSVDFTIRITYKLLQKENLKNEIKAGILTGFQGK